MKTVFRLDEQGFLVEDFTIPADEEVPVGCVDEVPHEFFNKYKWDGEKWAEGLTLEEIDALKNKQHEKSQIELMQEQIDQLILDSLMGV